MKITDCLLRNKTITFVSMNGESSGGEQLAEEQAKRGQSLSRKKKTRAGHKSYVTKICGKARAILDAYDPSQEVRLRQYRVTLEERLATFAIFRR